MNLLDIIDERLINISLVASDKVDAITKMCIMLYENGYISDVEKFKSDVIKREEIGETGIGNMIAIPHGQSSSVIKDTIAICKLRNEIQWETLDGKGVKVIILFAVQNDIDVARNHLALLAQVARKLAKNNVVEALLNATNSIDIIDIFK